jgi:uncharacterized membrane protein
MNGDGMMDKGPAINGRKLMITVIVGLIVFTAVSMVVTLGIGRVFGQVLNKKAMEHERAVDTQMMRDKEAQQKH